MKIRPSLLRLAALAGCVLAGAPLLRAQQPPVLDPATVEQRVDAILSQMTEAEKIDYVGGTPFFDVKAIPRFGIPQVVTTDGPVGVRLQPSTRYPAELALAATWNRARATEMGRGMGRDSRARGYFAILGPGLDFYRNPLGGRNFEYMVGEDPLLGGQMVAPFVKAIQDQGVWACAKHYVCNDQEFKRSAVDIEVSERALREIYLPPFEAAVKQGGAATVMGAYNQVNTDYSCESLFLDTQVLKQNWGFDGILLSDYEAIHNGLKAAQAGCDLDLPFSDFFNAKVLLPALQNGQLSQANLDDKVRRLLRKTIAFGFLDRPQLDSTIPLDDPSSEKAALDVAREGIVLLKNQDGLLPLKRGAVRTVAVMGRAAQGAPPTGFGSSYVRPLTFVSEISGIQYRAGDNVRVDYLSAGTANPATSVWESIDANGFVQAGLKGEYFSSTDLSGTAATTRTDVEVNFDWTQSGPPSSLTKPQSFSARWTGQVRALDTGDHLFKVRADGGVRVTVNGQVIIDNFATATPPAQLNGGYGTTVPISGKIALQANQVYTVELDYVRQGGYQGSDGGLQGVQFSWTPLVPPANLSSYDAVVMCQGTDSQYEGEGVDRPWVLPEFQDELITNVVAANPRTVVVLHGGGNNNLQAWIDLVPAVLHAWFPGEYGGLALGEILFGDVNPSGKLPVTFEKQQADNPAFPDFPADTSATTIRYNEGVFVGYRGYEKNGTQPQFPFGFGLSYTTFGFDQLNVSAASAADKVTVSFRVTNKGQKAGAEVAQVYVGQRRPKVIRPIKELKGFRKLTLQPGESRVVTVNLDRTAFAYFNEETGRFTVDPGTYDVFVGSSSATVPLRGRVRVTATDYAP